MPNDLAELLMFPVFHEVLASILYDNCLLSLRYGLLVVVSTGITVNYNAINYYGGPLPRLRFVFNLSCDCFFSWPGFSVWGIFAVWSESPFLFLSHFLVLVFSWSVLARRRLFSRVQIVRFFHKHI